MMHRFIIGRGDADPRVGRRDLRDGCGHDRTYACARRLGGQTPLPYEQITQPSPAWGRSVAPRHSQAWNQAQAGQRIGVTVMVPSP
ncbi:MAG: hypothetical protein WD336_01865 [Trueperaceae bacterium]